MNEMVKYYDYLDCLNNCKNSEGVENEELDFIICNERINLEINKLSAILVKNGVEDGGNTIFINSDMSELMNNLEYFQKCEYENSEHIGSLSARFLIYVKDFIKPNHIVIFNTKKPLLIGTLIINK